MSKADLDRLIAVSGALNPTGLSWATRDANGKNPPVFSSESAVIANAVPQRRAEFAAGRAAARAALARIGIAPVAIPSGPDRAPLWPEGVVGSITHTNGLCMAVVARGDRIRAVGVDLERLAPVPDHLIPAIGNAAELALLRPAEPGLSALQLFSMKEAAYKAQYGITRQFMGPQDIVLTRDGPVLTRDAPPLGLGFRLPTQQWRGFGLCLSLCVIPGAAAF